MDKLFRFSTDLRCFLANGETQILRNKRVSVEAATQGEALELVPSIATEMVHDAGGDWTDAPLDRLEVIHAVFEGAR